MKNMIVFSALALLILAIPALSEDFSYVGGQKCQICHKTEKQGQQFGIWEASKHAKSVASLSAPEAGEVAKTMGVEKPADDARCLKCHSPLADKAAELKPEGVSCEVCHGPGNEYKKLSVMKDKALSAKNGLILFGSPDAIKTKCMECHESPHGKEFDFASRWEKIKHPVPGK